MDQYANIEIESHFEGPIEIQVIQLSTNETTFSARYTQRNCILVHDGFDASDEYRVLIRTENFISWNQTIYRYEHYKLVMDPAGIIHVTGVGEA